jgi:preprotein translocase subunit YajC
MSWNHEQFPVNISESTDISLEIKNTTEVGDFDITIIFTDESGNITIERDLVLKVYPMDEDADNGDGDSILYQIIILIILLIIIIIIFKLITRKPKKQNKQNARKKK